jgi:hemolysin III
MYKGERFNSISHLLGAIFAVAGTSVLVTLAATKGDVWKIVAFSIYGAMMIFLYSISTIYHSVQGPSKNLFRQLDYFSIYLMIAGSYTPFTLVTLNGSAWGWWIFGLIWGMAVVGILQEILIGKKTRRWSLIIYAMMGWLIVIALKTLLERLPTPGVYWLVGGGLLYTAGIGVFVFDEKIKHGHGIWHLFVLAGTACHFVCMIGYVL